MHAVDELEGFESKLNSKNLTISELEHRNQSLKSQTESLRLDLEQAKIDQQVDIFCVILDSSDN